MKGILKVACGTALTVIVFMIMRAVLGNPSSMPVSIKNAYPPSWLANHGYERLGYLALIVLVLLHLVATAGRVGRRLDDRPVLVALSRGNRALMYPIMGALYGCIWFVAFLELGFVYYESMEIRCALSGLRDLVTLTASGWIFFALLSPKHVESLSREPLSNETKQVGKDLLVIPTSAMGFFALHALQSMVVFPSVESRMCTLGGFIWLFTFSLIIGFACYLFVGMTRQPILRAADFFLNVFGINWLLYNMFYNPTISIPLWELVVRSCAGPIGGLLGAVSFYLVSKAVN